LRFLIIFVFISLFSQVVTANNVHYYEDVALFRIQKKTVFFSDLRIYLKEYNSFRCLQRNSRILSNLKLDFKSIDKVPRLEPNYKSINLHKNFLNGVIKLIKMQVFSSRHNVSVSSKLLAHMNTKKCGLPKFSKWSNELKSLLQMELYVLERFPLNNKNDYKELNLFIDSVNDKVKHAVYF
jgi:hypothetical protein